MAIAKITHFGEITAEIFFGNKLHWHLLSNSSVVNERQESTLFIFLIEACSLCHTKITVTFVI